MLIAIAAIDQQNGLGRNGTLLVKLPMDLQRFKRLTIHGSVLIGRKTYESIRHRLPGLRKRYVNATTKSLRSRLYLHQQPRKYPIARCFSSGWNEILLTSCHRPCTQHFAPYTYSPRLRGTDVVFPRIKPLTSWSIVFEELSPLYRCQTSRRIFHFVDYQRRAPIVKANHRLMPQRNHQ